MRPALALVMLAACAASAPRPVAPARRLGDAMDEAGMRFGRAGRAVLADRWELAAYDLHELEEIFADDLATSSWHGKPELGKLAHSFQTERLTALRTAASKHDRAGYEHAAAEAARACNECHKAADMQYIEISTSLGDEVPLVATRTGQ